MSRPYGRPASSVAAKPVVPEFVPKQRSKEQLRQWQATFNMVSLLLKNHSRASLASSFAKLRRVIGLKIKYSNFLANKLNLLQRRKARQNIRWGFSNLQSNRISYYTARKQENNRIRDHLKAKAAALVVIISSKLEKNKLRSHLLELRNRSALKFKLNNFKTAHLTNLLQHLLAQRVREGWGKITRSHKQKITVARRLARLNKLIQTKAKQFQLTALTRLKVNVIRAKNAQEKPQAVAETKSAARPSLPTNDKESEAQIKRLEGQQKALNDKKKNLQRELSRAEGQNQRVLNELRAEIKRLESENEELGFNNGLLQESNQQLEREFQNRQKSTRKKLSRAQIWQNVYNNLIHFLTVNRDKTITKAALLECLQVPLVPCQLNLDQLNDQNKVLSELLEEYRKNFPAPETTEQGQAEMLPFDVIRKQNRYYYMVLEVLSEWGVTGSKELEQLNQDLTTLQKKLAQ